MNVGLQSAARIDRADDALVAPFLIEDQFGASASLYALRQRQPLGFSSEAASDLDHLKSVTLWRIIPRARLSYLLRTRHSPHLSTNFSILLSDRIDRTPPIQHGKFRWHPCHPLVERDGRSVP